MPGSARLLPMASATVWGREVRLMWVSSGRASRPARKALRAENPNCGQIARISEMAIEDRGPALPTLLLPNGTGSCGKRVVGITADQAYGSDH